MKKITHLLTILLMMLSIQIFAQYEDFESTAVGSIPNTWTRYQSPSNDYNAGNFTVTVENFYLYRLMTVVQVQLP